MAKKIENPAKEAFEISGEIYAEAMAMNAAHDKAQAQAEASKAKEAAQAAAKEAKEAALKAASDAKEAAKEAAAQAKADAARIKAEKAEKAKADKEAEAIAKEIAEAEAEAEAIKAFAAGMLAHDGYAPRGLCKALRAIASEWEGSRKEFVNAAIALDLNAGNAKAEWQAGRA